jgi:hypothetical protein
MHTLPSITFVVGVGNKAHITNHNLVAQFQISLGF